MSADLQKVASDAGYITPDQANAVLISTVQLPVFFEKLAADWGFAPQSDEEAISYLKMAADLRLATAGQQEKAANSRLSLIQRAQQDLGGVLHGTQSQKTASTIDHQIKSAAQIVAKNPAVAQAILSLSVS